MTFDGEEQRSYGVLASMLMILLGAWLGFLILQAVYNLYLHPLSGVPGPRSWSASRLPFVRALLKGTIVHDFQRLHREYGPIIRVAPDEVTFAQEEAWNDILRPRPDGQQFLKDAIWWGRQPGLPPSLINAIDPEEHAYIRKVLAPAFTPRALRSQEPIVAKYVNLFTQQLQDLVQNSSGRDMGCSDVDVTPWFNFLTFDIFGDLGFGESFDCLQNSKLHPWIALLFKSVKAASVLAAVRYYPLLRTLLEKCIPPSLKKMKAKHFQQIVDKVDRRLNLEMDRPDIMSHVVGGKQDDAGGLPVGVIYATFGVLTTAGSETTATVLSGIVNYLVKNPDKLRCLTEEIREAFQSGDEITLDTVRDLQYLNAVINEGLRLCPPIPWVLPRRVPPSGAMVCGTWLPGGTAVSIQAYTMNRRPDYFHDALSFLPERWLFDAISDPTSPFFGDRRQAIQAFSTGPRDCLGKHLAWAELRLTLCTMLWHFDLEAVPGRQLEWEELRTFLLVEKKPIVVRLKSLNRG